MICEPQLAPGLVEIPAGVFMMGETIDDKFATDTERPAHRVVFARPFALGRYPVTVGEYRAFVPAHAPGEDSDLPVVNVSWDDARAFCVWRRGQTGRPHRLPSEAEWEYACRAGTRTPFTSGNDLSLREANFLYSENGERIGVGTRTPVGCYAPNAFGLYDLHGNVCEWVEDAWHPDYAGAPADGSAWLDGGDPARRVIRGGAWDYLPRLLRSAWRDALPCAHRRDNTGFRLALTLDS